MYVHSSCLAVLCFYSVWAFAGCTLLLYSGVCKGVAAIAHAFAMAAAEHMAMHRVCVHIAEFGSLVAEFVQAADFALVLLLPSDG